MTYTPCFTYEAGRAGKWLVTCDHASNTVPPFVGNGCLGLGPRDMRRHIAWDVGAAGVTRALADALEAPAVLSNFSRLVIDPNRGMDDPTLLMKLYDGTIIPGNRHADDAERAARIDACYRPYHDAYEKLAERPGIILVAIHSFTPRLRGRADRPWEIGVLYHKDTRIAHPLIESLAQALNSPVGDNEPYAGHLPGDAIDQHGLQKGRPNVLIEIRNDLIETEADQIKWARFLAPHLETARLKANL